MNTIDTTDYVILKANAFARFKDGDEELFREAMSKQITNLIELDGNTARLWSDQCLIVERDEYLKDEERYQGLVASDAKYILHCYIEKILADVECRYTIDGEEEILVETPTEAELEKYL